MILKIQIEPIISTSTSKIFWWIKDSSIIQTKPFKLSLRIMNIGDEPIRGFTIQRIQFKSAGGLNIIHSVDKSFHIDTLNPDASTEIKVDEFGTYMHGLAQVDMNLVPDDASNTIETYQKDPFTKEISKYKFPNKWLDFLYVTSDTEYTQNANNNLLVFLTMIMFFGIVAQIFISTKQTRYVEIQSRGDRIFQAQAIQNAINFCEESPELEESGLYNPSNGDPASCSEVLERYKD